MKKLIFTLLTIAVISTVSAQVNLGPAINLGMSFYSNKTTDLSIEKTVSPAFGVAFEKYLDYWVSLRASALYSFEKFSISEKSNGNKDEMHGQFVNLFLEGIFSDFNESNKLYPYGSAGMGSGLNIISKDQENYLIGHRFDKILPFFTVGAGIRYSLTFNSKIDVSVNYNRCLSKPINIIDCRFNQISLKFMALF